jgi:hypothetical protein
MSAAGGTSGIYDSGEIRRFEGSPPDQTTIDVGLNKQLGSIVWFDAATVQNSNFLCRSSTERITQSASYEAMYLLRLFRGGSASCADGPNGFVGDGNRCELLGGKPLQAAIELSEDNILNAPSFALFKRLTDADDRLKPRRKSPHSASIDTLIGLSKQQAALRVA